MVGGGARVARAAGTHTRPQVLCAPAAKGGA